MQANQSKVPWKTPSLAAAFGLALLAPILALETWRASGFDKDGADMACMHAADPWPAGVTLEGSPVSGEFAGFPLGFQCQWHADTGDFVTVHQSWYATVMLLAGFLAGATAVVLVPRALWRLWAARS